MKFPAERKENGFGSSLPDTASSALKLMSPPKVFTKQEFVLKWALIAYYSSVRIRRYCLKLQKEILQMMLFKSRLKLVRINHSLATAPLSDEHHGKGRAWFLTTVTIATT